MKRILSDIKGAALFFGFIVGVVMLPGILLMRGNTDAHTFNREAVCRRATAHFFRVQDAPFKSYVGYEYGEAPGPRLNGIVHCDDPTHPVLVKVY